jgi:hypothetical protein
VTKFYISATFRDLQECRAAVQLALRRLRLEDMAMESYVADARAPLEKCLADVRECDVYIGIFAWRYGHVPSGQDRSITELEYREAITAGKECMIFLLGEEAPWPRCHVDRGLDCERVDRLRDELTGRHTCSIFTDAHDLATQVVAAVARYQANLPRAGSGPTRPAPDPVRRYLDRLLQHHGTVDLDALHPDQRADYLRIDLAEVFVEQWVREDAPPAELPRESAYRADAAEGTAVGVPGRTDPPPRDPDLAELLNRREAYHARPVRRLFDVLGAPEQRTVALLGDPGSGKSTVARYVVTVLAAGRPDDRLAALADHLPLLIELRSYVTMAGEGRCTGFVDYLDRRAATDGLGIDADTLRRHLSDGRPVLAVFDGLDEVFDRRLRDDVAGQIVNFAAAHPAVRVVVTSRLTGYARRILSDAGFRHFTLQDLDETQTTGFLTRWYRLSSTGHAERQRGLLLEAIRHSWPIRELAGNPLLLTILAIIGRDRVLPRERWRLYDHAATVLVEHWDVNRHLRDQHGAPAFLDPDSRKELLRRLAYRMQAGERGLAVNHVAAGELTEVFERYLVEELHHDPVEARASALTMIDQFRERHFVLSRYGPHHYGFVHRTFLEFFCADAILQKFQREQELSADDLRELFRRHWADPSWREVLRLLSGALHERHTGPLIELLTSEVNRPWPPGAFTAPPWNLALAVQCLAEVRNLTAVAGPARALLRQLVLLLEHCVSIDDRETVALIGDEILPAAASIGPHWPGRDSYLHWYRRRGVRVVWSGVSAHAARLAALLSTPAERVDDLFDEVLGAMDDRLAAYASVAGLAEVARIANAAEGTAHRAAAVRARERLVSRARSDPHAVVRLAAVQALGERFGTDPQARAVLLEQARSDGYAGVRLAAVQALGEPAGDEPAVRELLCDRARGDPQPVVRRAAVRVLAGWYTGEPVLGKVLLDCLRHDTDAEVLRAAAGPLLDRPQADGQVRDLLVERARTDGDPVRRVAVRILAERLDDDGRVRALLVGRVADDRDPVVLRTAALALTDRPEHRDQVRDLLLDRVGTDPDGVLRRVALTVLLERLGRDPATVALLPTAVRADRDAEVRLTATTALADRAGVDAGVSGMLCDLARRDADARVRLAAARCLVERVGMDPEVCAALADLADTDPAAAVREAAVRALASCVEDRPGLRERIVTRARQDSDPAVRLAAVGAVARLAGAHPDVREMLADRTRNDPDAEVFRQAAGAVATPAPRMLRTLVKRLRDESNARVRLAAVQLLVDQFTVTDPVVRDVLLDRVRLDPDPELVRHAAATLAERLGPDPEQREVLLVRVADPDPGVRAVLVQVLGGWFGAGQTVRDLLTGLAVRNPDVQVRREALRVLGDHLTAHPEVRELFVDRLHDPDWSVRAAAVRVLGSRFGDDERTMSLLVGLARTDPDPGFRRLAGQALTWLPGADPDQLPDVTG